MALSAAARARLATAIKWVTPALIVSIAIPLWRTYWVETADLHLEVTQVERRATENARLVDISRDENLRFLLDTRGIFAGRSVEPAAPRDIADVERLLDQYQRDYVTSAEASIASLRKRLDEITVGSMTWELARKLNNPLDDEVEVRRQEFEAKKSDQIYLASLVEAFKERYQVALKEQTDTLTASSDNVRKGNLRLQAIKDDLDKREARVWVGSAVTNSGRGAISLRREGVLRVYLGGSSYIDLELEVDKYDTKADLQPKSSRIINFFSAPLRTLKTADQDRILSYPGIAGTKK
jgi:hypothetical protein